MNTKYDYDRLEREYVVSDLSLREMSRNHGIPHSLLTQRSREKEWVRKRQEYRRGAAEKAVIYMADQEGARRAREAVIHDHALDAIDEAIMKMREDMRRTRTVEIRGELVEEPLYVMKPQDVALLLDRLQVLIGKPSQITEDRNLELKLDGVTPDLLRQFVDATRGLEPDSASESPIPRAYRTGEG